MAMLNEGQAGLLHNKVNPADSFGRFRFLSGLLSFVVMA